MSELLPGVHIVEGVGMPGRPGTVNVCLLVSFDGTATLIDAGFPGVAERLRATLETLGLPVTAVRRVIITHHHPDHISGLPEVIAMTGAEVWAHAADADVIDGSAPRQMPAAAPQAHGALGSITPAPVDLRLVGGETLGVLGGCEILHTPGHTHGHLSLYLPTLSLLIAGDILRYEHGLVTRAPEHYTIDQEANEVSLQALAEKNFERLLPYHGEYLGTGASEQMRRDLGMT
jgi:glyoxylase-like metal-dependent hydrolase (beta-lactamase superfamily II)